jgi:hypothetical protein
MRLWTPKRRMIEVPTVRMPLLMLASVEHRNAAGELLWAEYDRPNVLTDMGTEYLLSAAFATGLANFGAAVANVYLALDNRATLAQTDTLATLSGENALGQYGYSRLALSTAGSGAAGQDFVIAKATYYAATSKALVWTGSGQAWTAVKNLNLVTDATATTDASGKHLICAVALSQSRTVGVGDTLTSSIVLTPSGA